MNLVRCFSDLLQTTKPAEETSREMYNLALHTLQQLSHWTATITELVSSICYFKTVKRTFHNVSVYLDRSEPTAIFLGS